MIGYVILGLVVVVGIYVIATYNRIVSVSNKIEEALSDIDVALVRRYDTLNNLVECVKGYVKYEGETIVKVIEARKITSMAQREAVEQNQQEATKQLFALAESYPNLKASANFLQLQNSIKELEEHVSASRRMYNSNVSIFNDLLMKVPSCWIANMAHAEKKFYFEAEADERQNVNVKL